jgi:hypothetical protein
MTYTAKLKVQFGTEWTQTYGGSGIYDDETLPEEHYTFEIPCEDINAIQLFRFFATIARAMGHNEIGIMKGACSLAFNDMRSEEDMKKIAYEFDLKLSEEYSKEFAEMQDEIYDLKAKLSRCQQPDNPNYTEEEMDALCSQNEITADILKSAEVVCRDCGSKYGHYSVGCSSTWTGTCNVCGQEKSITEVRDWNYLKEGIDKLSK